MARIRSSLLLLLLCGTWGVPEPCFAQGELVPTYSNIRSLRIGFGIDQSRKIQEIRLYASWNKTPWVKVGTALPTHRAFEFKSDRDGEFEFAVQVVYEGGAIEPPVHALRPYQKAIIDTTAPNVVMRPIQGSGNQPGIEWEVRDANLDASSLRLEYRWPGQNDWIQFPEAISPRGSTTWPLSPGQRLEVRILAADLAKNRTVSNTLTIPGNIGSEIQSGGAPPTSRPGSGGSLGGSLYPNANSGVAPPANMFFVPSRNIVLTVGVVKEGPSKIVSRELWVKPANREWHKAPREPRQLPADDGKPDRLKLVYEAEGDGLYGFTVVAKSGVGISGRIPQQNDAPQVYVEVDTVKPVVKFKDVKVIPGAENHNVVRITWEASDKNLLPDTPINLEFATDPKGPWEEIAMRQPNSGFYEWTPPYRPPYRYWIRIRAVDRATNVGEAIWKEPVTIDLEVPEVQIFDVSPMTSDPASNNQANPNPGLVLPQ